MEPELEQHIVDVCGGYPGVVAVYLFGSVASGTHHPSSDVDVAVLLEQPPPALLGGPRLELEGELERSLGRRVDLIVLNQAPADLRIRVLRGGRLLLERDRSARIAFEVRTRNEAFDLALILAAYRAPRTRVMTDTDLVRPTPRRPDGIRRGRQTPPPPSLLKSRRPA